MGPTQPLPACSPQAVAGRRRSLADPAAEKPSPRPRAWHPGTVHPRFPRCTRRGTATAGPRSPIACGRTGPPQQVCTRGPGGDGRVGWQGGPREENHMGWVEPGFCHVARAKGHPAAAHTMLSPQAPRPSPTTLCSCGCRRASWPPHPRRACPPAPTQPGMRSPSHCCAPSTRRSLTASDCHCWGGGGARPQPEAGAARGGRQCPHEEGAPESSPPAHLSIRPCRAGILARLKP